jgi:hypothetical protein
MARASFSTAEEHSKIQTQTKTTKKKGLILGKPRYFPTSKLQEGSDKRCLSKWPFLLLLTEMRRFLCDIVKQLSNQIQRTITETTQRTSSVTLSRWQRLTSPSQLPEGIKARHRSSSPVEMQEPRWLEHSQLPRNIPRKTF